MIKHFTIAFSNFLLRAALLLLSLTFALAHAAPKQSFKGEIIISLPGQPERVAGYDALIAAYHKYQPNVDVLVELKGAALGGGSANSSGGYPTWLNTQLASGQPRPDLVASNYSVPYNGYIDFDYYRKVVNPYTGRPWDADLDFDFFASRDSNGVRMMLATQAITTMWFYNQDIFDKYGLKVPQTWEAFMQVCAQLKAKGIQPLSIRFDYTYYQWLGRMLWDQYNRAQILEMVAQPGDWCYDPQADGNWKFNPQDVMNDSIPTVNRMRMLGAYRDRRVRYDTPEFRQFLLNLREVARYGPSDFILPSSDSQGSPYMTFMRQQAAMHLDSSYALQQVERDLKEARERAGRGQAGELRPFRWGTFNTPPQTNPLVTSPIRSVESCAGEYIGIIDKNQPQTDMVLDFVMFWLSPEGYQAFVDGQAAAGQFLPYGRPVIKGVKFPPEFERLFANIRSIGNAENDTVNMMYMLPMEGSNTRMDSMLTLSNFVQGKLDEKQAAKKLQEIIVTGAREIITKYHLEDAVAHPERNPNR